MFQLNIFNVNSGSVNMEQGYNIILAKIEEIKHLANAIYELNNTDEAEAKLSGNTSFAE